MKKAIKDYEPDEDLLAHPDDIVKDSRDLVPPQSN